MAATNPFRVSDLIAKYGWKVMPYLSNLGVRSLAEAQILFVDVGHTNALDADDTEHGHSLEKPLASIDYAIGLLTASEAGVILVAPGHVETKAATGALNTVDVNGITIIGLGEGLLRPTLTLSTHTGAVGFLVSAANVTLINMRILVSIDALVSAISVTGTDCKLIDMEVQDNADTTEAAVAILTSATADRLHIERFRHNGFVSGDECTESISLIGVDRAVIKDCWFRGTFSIAGINMLTTACTGIIIENCKFENGTEALVSNIVDNQASSVWSAINCWDVVGGYAFNGGSGTALAQVRLNAASKSAHIYFVDNDTGSAGNDGLTWATAKATIQQGVDLCIAPNSTVYVGGSGYSEAVTTSGVDNCRIIDVCGNKQKPLWQSGDGSLSHLTVVDRDWEIIGFRFHGGDTNTVAFIHLDGEAGGLTCRIEDCMFSAGGSTGGAIEFDYQAYDHRIINCEFVTFTMTGDDGGALYGKAYGNSATNCHIIGCTFLHCVSAISLQASMCVFKDNIFNGRDRNDTTTPTTTSTMDLLNASSANDDGAHIGDGANIITGNVFGDHFSWELVFDNGYKFSDTDVVVGNFCLDGVQGSGGYGAAAAERAILVPGKTYSLKSSAVALTGGDVVLWNIAGGPIKLSALALTITAVTSTTSKVGFSCTPTNGAETDLTATGGSGLEVNGNQIGDMMWSALDNGIMELADIDGTAVPTWPAYSQIVPAGAFNLVMENSNPTTGAADVYIEFTVLGPGVSVTPA